MIELIIPVFRTKSLNFLVKYSEQHLASSSQREGSGTDGVFFSKHNDRNSSLFSVELHTLRRCSSKSITNSVSPWDANNLDTQGG